MSLKPIESSKEYYSKNKRSVIKYADAFFTAAALFFSSQLIGETTNQVLSVKYTGLLMFIFVALSRGLTAMALGKEDKQKKIVSIIFLGLYVVCAFVYFFVEKAQLSLGIVSTVYFAEIILMRILSMFTKRKIWNYIFSGIIILACLLYVCSAFEMMFMEEDIAFYTIELMLLSFMIVTRSLVHIIDTSFSQLKLGILRKIIRKTYAGEILFGLLMLIISFSMIFVVVEHDTFPTYNDALWYCFAVVTTIGFGDFAAVGWVARIGSVILGLYGIVVVAVITSVIINFYNEVKDDKDDGGDEGASSDPSEEATSEGEATQEVAPSVDMKPKNINLTEKKKKDEKP